MEPVTTAALIGAGIAAGSSGGNIISQSSMNKKTRAWNEKMYKRQQEDNLRLNSPRAQMQRFQEAGLNPHLIYGQGNVMDVPKPQSWNPTAPTIDPSIGQQIVNSHFQNKASSAQADLTRQAIETEKAKADATRQEAALKALELAKGTELYPTAIDTAKQSLLNLKAETELKGGQLENIQSTTRLNRQQEEQNYKLFPLQIEEQTARIENIKQDTLYKANRIMVDATSNAQNIKESAQRIKESLQRVAQSESQVRLIDQQFEKLLLDTHFQEVVNHLADNNIMPGDRAADRALIELFDSALGPLAEKLDGPAGQILKAILAARTKRKLPANRTTTTYKGGKRSTSTTTYHD